MVIKRPAAPNAQPPRPAAPPPPKPKSVAAPSAEPAGAAVQPDTSAVADAAASNLLTTREAAVVLRVNHKRLERWRMTGEGPAYVRMTSKSIAYRRCDIDAFVADRLRTSTAA